MMCSIDLHVGFCCLPTALIVPVWGHDVSIRRSQPCQKSAAVDLRTQHKPRGQANTIAVSRGLLSNRFLLRFLLVIPPVENAFVLVTIISLLHSIRGS
jgi:hypothetical protein